MLKAVYDPTGKEQDVYAYVDTRQPVYTTITLSVAGWDAAAKTQTVTVAGIESDETKQLIQPVPASANRTVYSDAGIRCIGQSVNSLTFSCKTVPTEDMTVYIVVQPLV